MPSPADEDLSKTFESLFEVIRSAPFLTRQGLSNELPFFISAHHASLQSQVTTLVPLLVKRLSNHGISVLHLNLYDLVVDLLHASGRWPRILDREKDISKDRFFETMRNVTSPKDHLNPLIKQRLAESECQVLLLDGVGLVFPYLRSHSVLENLQTVTKQTPTILFFPGDYSVADGKGCYLKLFGTLPDDRYYRAFNITDFKI